MSLATTTTTTGGLRQLLLSHADLLDYFLRLLANDGSILNPAVFDSLDTLLSKGDLISDQLLDATCLGYVSEEFVTGGDGPVGLSRLRNAFATRMGSEKMPTASLFWFTIALSFLPTQLLPSDYGLVFSDAVHPLIRTLLSEDCGILDFEQDLFRPSLEELSTVEQVWSILRSQRSTCLSRAVGVRNVVPPRLCLVCGDEVSTTALIPCGHRCVCARCSSDLLSCASSVCPVCRSSFKSSVFIYD